MSNLDVSECAAGARGDSSSLLVNFNCKLNSSDMHGKTETLLYVNI